MLFQSLSSPDFAIAVHNKSLPSRPELFSAVAFHFCAMPSRFVSLPKLSRTILRTAYHCSAFAVQSIATPLHRIPMPLRTRALLRHCHASLCLCEPEHRHAFAEPRCAFPLHIVAILSYSHALRSFTFASPRKAFASRSQAVASHRNAIPLQVNAYLCHGESQLRPYAICSQVKRPLPIWRRITLGLTL